MAEELSLWNLILGAGLIVQATILLLVVLSVVSWAMIVKRVQFLRSVEEQVNEFEDRFWSGDSLADFYKELDGRSSGGEQLTGLEGIFHAGFKEFQRLRERLGNDTDALMAGVQRSMRVALTREEDLFDRNLPFLATVGSTSPYIGLFGTVWGIMRVFRDVAGVPQVSLTTVAPGISETLIATALGLFAAIPAVIAYNRFLVRGNLFIGNYKLFTEEFIGILNRQVYSSSEGRPAAAPAGAAQS